MSKEEERIAKEAEEAFAKRERERKEKAKRFNPADFLNVRRIHTIYDEEFGEIQYTDLTIDDSLELAKIEDKDERIRFMVWAILRHTYPDLKREDVGKLPQPLLQVLTEKVPFFGSKS